jgi:uncharacterized membrane protein YbhN (UPF0104 family)
VVNKRIVINACKYGLAVGLLAYIVYRNWDPPGGKGLKALWDRPEPFNFGFLAAAFAFYAAALVLTLVRWYYLVRAQDLPFRLPDALRLGLVGFFFNTFLPGAVGGDVIKAAFLAREQSRRTVAVATVIMDRIIALWGLFWFVALLGALFWAAGSLEGSAAGKITVGTAGAVVAGSVVVWMLLGLLPPHRAERFAGRLGRLPKVGHSAAEFWRAVWMYRCRQKSVALALLISWVGFIGFVGAFYCCARALWDGDLAQPVPSLLQHFLIVPMGLVIQAIPGSPGGAGIGELGFGILYQWFGYSAGLGQMSTLLQRVITWTLGFLGYLIYARMRTTVQPAAPAEAAVRPLPLHGELRQHAEPEATSAS